MAQIIGTAIAVGFLACILFSVRVAGQDCVCAEIFAPVCANGVTYSSRCHAACANQHSFHEGECRETTPAPTCPPSTPRVDCFESPCAQSTCVTDDVDAFCVDNYCGGCFADWYHHHLHRLTECRFGGSPIALHESETGCPVNCGWVSAGGGGCETNDEGELVCNRCNTDKLLFRGRCVNKVNCKGGSVVYGRFSGESCSCDQPQCHQCLNTVNGSVCKKCKDGFYLHQGRCVESCPAELAAAGTGNWNRRCLHPFVCKGARLWQLNNDMSFVRDRSVNYKCLCPQTDSNGDRNCAICDFRAGERGDHCLRCKSGQYLYQGACYESCTAAGAPAHFIEHIPRGAFDRQCRAPFTCRDGKDEAGLPCLCPKAIRNKCVACSMDATGAVCDECKTGFQINPANGRCRRMMV